MTGVAEREPIGQAHGGDLVSAGAPDERRADVPAKRAEGLEAAQIELLHGAMLAAFRTIGEIEIALVPIWPNLREVVAEEALELVYLNLIRRANGDGLVRPFLRALRRRKPWAPKLRAFIETHYWLVPPLQIEQAALNDLADILSEVPRSLDRLLACARDLYLEDRLPPGPIASLHAVLEALSEIPVCEGASHPVVEVAACFAQDLHRTGGAGGGDEERRTAREIERWCERIRSEKRLRVQRDWRAGLDPSGAGPCFLVIQVQNQAPIHVLKAWIVHEGGTKEIEPRDTSGEVIPALERLVRDALRPSLFKSTRGLQIEFVMAPEHFHLEVDALTIDLGHGVVRPIGRRYPVFIRPHFTRNEFCAENREHRWALLHEFAKRRSAGLSGVGPEGSPCHFAPAVTSMDFDREFKDWNHRFCLILSQPPSNLPGLVIRLVTEGVPVALWPRPNAANTQVLEKLVSEPHDLPRTVFLARQDGLEATLLWDDLSRPFPPKRDEEGEHPDGGASAAPFSAPMPFSAPTPLSLENEG